MFFWDLQENVAFSSRTEIPWNAAQSTIVSISLQTPRTRWIVKKLAQKDIYVTNLRQNTNASYARVYDPIPKHFHEHGIIFDGKRFSIDHSHGVPETEFHTEEGAEWYQEFLEYVESGQFAPSATLWKTSCITDL